MQRLTELEILREEDVKNLSRELLSGGKTVKLRLGGYSMYPNFLPGDVATIGQVETSTLKLGQIVVAEMAGRWIAHRLVAWRTVNAETVLITQGDSVSRPDAHISIPEVMGVVQKLERAGKSVALSDRVAWLYLTFRPLPQIVGRLVLKVRRKVGQLR